MNKKPYSDLFDSAARESIPDHVDLAPRIMTHIQKGKGIAMQPRLKVFAAVLLAVAVSIILLANGPAVVHALQGLFGYVPGIGLVENPGGMRVLAQPASLTRDGVTVTVTTALVYDDHVELVYEVTGISPADDGSTPGVDTTDMSAFCFDSQGDAALRLPDGTVLQRVFSHAQYPQNIFANKPVYVASIPADVNELTMLLKCLPWTRRGTIPEDWAVTFQLSPAPAGTTVGEPVIDVAPSSLSKASANGITITLEKVVPQADTYSFYFSIVSEQQPATQMALYPFSASLIDSRGQKIALIYNFPWQPYDNVALWELQPVSRPADGPFTIVIDKLNAYYDAGGVSFAFDPGADPQLGQTWSLDQTLTVQEYGLKLVSARMVEKPEYGDGATVSNPQGFEFRFRALDGTTRLNASLSAYAGSDNFYANYSGPHASPEFSAGILYAQGAVPTGPIQVTIDYIYVEKSGNWTLRWTPAP